MKCDQCGLVNFKTASTCKRCGAALAVDSAVDSELNSLDASGGSVFRNLHGAAQVVLIHAAASTQTFDGFSSGSLKC